MSKFRVSFYKTLQDASGHSSKHLQKQLDLTSDSPSGALVAAERLFDPRGLEADRVEVVRESITDSVRTLNPDVDSIARGQSPD